jgi:hypothetical protein
MYNPTKADQWSSGQVLLYLLGGFQVAGSPSVVANVAVERKASRSLQDTVEVDGENAKLPRVKKQKLSEEGGVLVNHGYLDLWLAFDDIFLFLVLVTIEPIEVSFTVHCLSL